MGYMRHDAIIVTSWNSEAIEAAAEKAREIGLYIIGPGDAVENLIRTMLVCPDGSKEGWKKSDDFDEKRIKYLKYLDSVHYEDGSSCLSWVAIAYGGDMDGAFVTEHSRKVKISKY